MDFSKLTEGFSDKEFVKELGNPSDIYFVGGCVRDTIIKKDSKDIDILVRKKTFTEIENILKKYGSVKRTNVGDRFGVLKFIPTGESESIDISLPRKENKGEGEIDHTNFDVFSDPNLTIEEDLGRRDFTMNSIAVDLTGKVIDPFKGVYDTISGIIKATNFDAFLDDPLRLLRCVQFMARLNFRCDSKTYRFIVNNVRLISKIKSERIYDELEKIFEKGDHFKGINILLNTGLFNVIFGSRSSKTRTLTTNNKVDFFYQLISHAKGDISQLYIEKLKGDKHTAKRLKLIQTLNLNSEKVRFKNRILLWQSIAVVEDILDYISIDSIFEGPINQFRSGEFPKKMSEIKIDGKDVIDIIGEESEIVGIILNEIVGMILSRQIDNDRNKLLEYVKSKKNNEIL